MHRRAESVCRVLAAFGLSAGLLTACTALAPVPPPPAPPPVVTATPVPVVAPHSPPLAVVELLAHADRLGQLSGAELDAELEALRLRQGANAWLKSSLLHAHKQPPELQRAIELSSQALADTSAEGLQLQPLARLLGMHYAQQRKLQEQLDKQGRQVADLQRKLDQSLERLEALKAIERSLGRRGSPARSGEATVP